MPCVPGSDFLPSGQSSQEEYVEYFPAPHCEQVMSPVLVVTQPGLHWVHELAPVEAEKKPVSQATQADSAILPLSLLALPVPHSEHLATSSFSEARFPPLILYVPEGQSIQSWDLVPPVLSRYLPWPQTEH